MDFITNMPGTVYVEADLGSYGLLDAIPGAFKYHKEVYIVRDGRDWLRFMLNWGEVYGKKGVRNYLSHGWVTASSISEDPYAENWDRLSRFEKLCWPWTKLNRYALDSAVPNPQTRIFHVERIFLGKERYEYLGDLVEFATSLPGHGSCQGWERWTADQKGKVERMGGG